MKKSDAAFSATVSQPAAWANYIVRRQFRAEKTINAKVEIEFANALPRSVAARVVRGLLTRLGSIAEIWHTTGKPDCPEIM